LRGKTAKKGDERVAPNGYSYVKTKDRGWMLKHHIIAEEKYNRKVDKDITVRFLDGDRTNFDPDNIIMRPKSLSNKSKRIAIIKARIRELEAELLALASDE